MPETTPKVERDAPPGAERPLSVPDRRRRSVVDDPRLRAQLKAELRRQLRAVRGALPPEARAERSARIAERVMALDAWSPHDYLAAFVSIRGEADPHALVRTTLEAGGRVAFPRVDTEANEIVMHETRDLSELTPSGAYDIPEPTPEAPLAALAHINLVIVPALGVDPLGRRIGWGRGFYDRLLPRLPNAVRVAIAYDFQLLAEIPDHPHDQRMDFVVTDARTIDVRAEREG